MEELILPKMLLIAGTGRNSGKTTLACSVIRKFKNSFPMVAFKISPHVHANVKDREFNNLYVTEELDVTGQKDSSRMLAAGARKAYYIVVRDELLPEALQQILSLADPNDFIVCESGGLRNIVTPGLFIMMSNGNMTDRKPMHLKFRNLCDAWIEFHPKNFSFPDYIEIDNNSWKLKL